MTEKMSTNFLLEKSIENGLSKAWTQLKTCLIEKKNYNSETLANITAFTFYWLIIDIECQTSQTLKHCDSQVVKSGNILQTLLYRVN